MKKGLPKAQKGLAKLAKVIKTASKTSGNTTKGAKPVVRKARRIADAQKSLSASALSGMTASQLRSKLSSLMKQASAASTSKASTKKLALKQKGGPIGKVTPAQKKYLSKVKDTNSMTPPGTAKTKKDLKKATRQKGKTVTSPSGLTQRVNRKGVVKKNQGGGRPMSAKKAVRKMTRKRG
mgnify:CR=1 FL=1|jgi:phosphate starvation-inducible protein PhoH|tara:strand:+ start:1135 stop:1674 length:540 start_codon:yes stop_codon:yes gene_type:complete